MTREEARLQARGRLEEYLERLGVDTAKAAASGAACPICGGGHKSPCFHFYKPERWTCFSEGKSGDIFDLYAALNGSPDPAAAMSGVYRELGLTVEGAAHSTTGRQETKQAAKVAAAPRVPMPLPPAAKVAAPAGDFVEFLMEAASHIEEPEALAYLSKRGISLSTAMLHGLGYAARWRSPKVSGAVPSSPRLIIPRGKHSYLARDIRPEEEIPEAARKYVKQQAKTEGSEMEIFNIGTLDENGSEENGKPVYIVEGELDALSIVEAGGAAVALGSKGNYKRLLTEAARLAGRNNAPELAGTGVKVWDPAVIIALDADGKTASETGALLEGLERLGVEVMAADTVALYGGAKDANEALVRDRASFSERVITSLSAYRKAKVDAAAIREEEYRKAKSAAAFADAFKAKLDEERELISSGYAALDKAISGWAGGGLPAGLYVLGACSSTGKTTFLIQMADQMAKAGRDVLFFSLEMSRFELIGKSISRTSLLRAVEKHPQLGLRVLDGYAYSWSDIRDFKIKQDRGFLSKSTAREEIDAAAADYFEKIAPHVFIIEGALNGTSMEAIEAKVREHTEKTGAAPVVFIDYLQMIAAPAGMETASDKSITDSKIRACKCLSRDFNTPVLVISSFNRESYYRPVSLTSFKESGSIEYTADIVLGLQYLKMGELKPKEAEEMGREIEAEMKRELIRPVEVVVLKNRSGGMSDKPLFQFYAKYNYFAEVEEVANGSEAR